MVELENKEVENVKTVFVHQKQTSVELDVKDIKWLKDNDIKIRNAVKAGIKYIECGTEVASLNAQVAELRIKLANANNKKDIVAWLFYNHKEIYFEALKACANNKEES